MGSEDNGISGADGQNDDPNTRTLNVEGVAQAAIDGKDRVELLFGQAEQRAILCPCPAHLLSGAYVKANEVALQLSRNALIEQYAHLRRAALWLVRVLGPLTPG